MPLNGFSEDQIDHLENTLDPSVVANRKQGGSQVAYIQPSKPKMRLASAIACHA